MTKFIGPQLDMVNVKIVNLALCTTGLDAANKNYVDSVAVPPGGALYDGGTPSTVSTGLFKIDFGSPT